MSIPTIRALISANCSVSLILKGPAERQIANELLAGNEFDAITLQNLSNNRLIRAWQLLAWIRKRRFDYAFSQYGVNTALYSALTLFGGVKRRFGWAGSMSWLNTGSISPRGDHKVIEAARLLEFVGIAPKVEYFDADIPKASSLKGEKPLVVLAPGSGIIEKHKRWPDAFYAQLARQLVGELDAQVRVLGGPDEYELCGGISDESGSGEVVNVAGSLNISESFSLLKNADVVVANCNGVSHMAAAVGTPVVGLYGPTDYKRTGPFMQQFSVVSLGMECSPCYRRGFIQGCGNPVCMEGISVASVLQAVRAVLTKSDNRKDHA